MALGKLWNALFGKRPETEANAMANVVERSDAAASAQIGKSVGLTTPSAKTTLPHAGNVPQSSVAERPILKTKRKALVGKARKSAQAPALVVAEVSEVAEVAFKRIPHPKKNAWTKLIAGRQILSILDTNLGDASRAVELLEAIVCDSVPTPKYVAIDDFDLASGGTTVLQFHQQVRRVGGKAVPIPGSIDEGLRQLSRTIGTVDLVLIDDAKPQLHGEDTQRLLNRVTHSGTLVLRRDAKNNWTIVELGVIASLALPKSDISKAKSTRAA
ncbi:MAG TPA: hypothetical protein DDZ51_00755 [Planctomycetaceae bacterium]|nr:hypothetical protein [Planctomycetaceae bacterium]